MGDARGQPEEGIAIAANRPLAGDFAGYAAINAQDPSEGTQTREEGWDMPNDLLHIAFPILTIIGGVATYSACRVIAVTTHAYLGEIPFPFFSDTGRDPPAYYLFVVGLTAGAICYLASYRLVYARMTSWEDAMPQGVQRFDKSEGYRSFFAAAGLLFATAASPCLVTLAIFDTSSFPLVHQLAADLFSSFTVLATISYTCYFRRLVGLYPAKTALRVSMIVKTLVCAIWVVAFMVYVPIGMAVCCPARQLTMGECLKVPDLQPGYCMSKVNSHDHNYTILWTYKDCPELFTMRTIAQFTCIMCVMVFAGTFSIDLGPTMRYLT